MIQNDQGETLNPGKNDLGPGAVLIEVDIYCFDLGFTFKESDTTKNWLVTDVEQNSQAWQAGLRKEYTIIGRSIHWGQSDKPVILVFLNNQGEKTRIEYLPQGEKKTVHQYRLIEEFFNKNRAECLKWFGATDLEH